MSKIITIKNDISTTKGLNEYIEDTSSEFNEIFNHFNKRFRYYDEEDERYIFNTEKYESFCRLLKEKQKKMPNLTIKVTVIYDDNDPNKIWCYELHR